MKVFSKEQIYEGDKLTTERQNISSTDLMERAGTQIFNWMHMRMQGAQVPIHVFCGIGNNGGDGLVLSRQLIIHGYNVKTYIINYSETRSKDFLINYDRIKSTTKDWPVVMTSAESFPDIHQDDIIVDAVFGIGLNRPPADWVADLFLRFRDSKAFTLSIDIPSGLYTDKPVDNSDAVVHANFTLSFQSPKLVFFLPETATFTTQWEVLDIGIDREYLMQTETEVELISKHEVLPFYKPRKKFSHKGHFGHGLIIGGSYGKIGAVHLSARAVLTVGAGLVTAYVPQCGYTALQASLPEAMVITDANTEIITAVKVDFEPNAVGIGIGLGTAPETSNALEEFLKINKKPLVIDADAINILAKQKHLLALMPENSVFTPHPKELEGLIGSWSNDFEKLDKTEAFSLKHKVIVVIKGANTITVYGKKKYINVTGNPGLSTAGTGDVLTGIITGLICQGYSEIEATLFGIYLHGRSADLALEEYGYHSLLASNVIDYIAEAYSDLFKQPEQQQVQSEEEE